MLARWARALAWVRALLLVLLFCLVLAASFPALQQQADFGAVRPSALSLLLPGSRGYPVRRGVARDLASARGGSTCYFRFSFGAQVLWSLGDTESIL
jgi:hypothetical protein